MDLSGLGGKGSLLVVLGKLSDLSGNSNSLQDVVDERVHDGHTLGDASIWVNLLEDLVDVR